MRRRASGVVSGERIAAETLGGIPWDERCDSETLADYKARMNRTWYGVSAEPPEDVSKRDLGALKPGGVSSSRAGSRRSAIVWRWAVALTAIIDEPAMRQPRMVAVGRARYRSGVGRLPSRTCIDRLCAGRLRFV